MALADYRTAMPRGIDYRQNLPVSSSPKLAALGRLSSTSVYHHCASSLPRRLDGVVCARNDCCPAYLDQSNKLILRMPAETALLSSTHLRVAE